MEIVGKKNGDALCTIQVLMYYLVNIVMTYHTQAVRFFSLELFDVESVIRPRFRFWIQDKGAPILKFQPYGIL